MRLLFCIIALISNICLYAQNIGNESYITDAQAQQLPLKERPSFFNEMSWKVRSKNPSLALEYARKAASVAIETKNDEQLALAYNYIGVNSRKLGFIADAIEYFNKSIEVSSRIGMKDEEGYGYNNLGMVYTLQGSYDDAEEYLKKAFKIANELNDSMLLGYVNLSLGEAYTRKGDTSKALTCLNASKKIREKINAPQSAINAVIFNIGNLYQTTGNYTLAKNCYRYNIQNSNESIDLEQTAVVTLHLSEIYYEQSNYDSALYFAQRSLFFAEEIGNKSAVRDAYKVLGNTYYKKHDDKNAAISLAMEMAYNDSISNEGQAQKIFDVQTVMGKYENEEEIRKINQENKRQTIVLVASSTALVLLVIFFVRLGKQRKRLQQLNASLNEQQKQITDSINYSQKIQEAVLPDLGKLGYFSDKFVIYRPKDIVSGDFYWLYDNDRYDMLAVADCMGRGVPGAFMSLLGTTALQEIAESGVSEAGEALSKLRTTLTTMLSNKSQYTDNVGMRIALVIVKKDTGDLNYSGANLPVVIVRNGKAEVLQPDSANIDTKNSSHTFSSQTTQLQKGDSLYLSADRFCMEAEPDNGMIRLLSDISDKNMEDQKTDIVSYYNKNNKVSTNDICVVGLRM